MTTIALRAYTKRKEDKEKYSYRKNTVEEVDIHRYLVFDTETTIDCHQNLLFGSFRIYENGKLDYEGLLYSSNIGETDKNTLEHYAKEQHLPLLTREEFIDNVLYPEIYHLKTRCVGFNLPFDLSRIALKATYTKGKRFHNGFSLQLSENRSFPRIKIKHTASRKNLMGFGTPKVPYHKHFFKGYFIDVQNLACVLSDNQRISLKQACELFGAEHKKFTGVTHGKITADYIDYNRRDVEATHEVFEALRKEFALYGINIPLHRIVSAASIGKALYRQLGIQPFSKCNPTFPVVMSGFLTSSFYGGRCEVLRRNIPTKVTTLDFRSMYSSLNILMGMEQLLRAEQIDIVDDTKAVQEFLDNVTLESLQNKEIWKDFIFLVQIKPNALIVPVRMKYGQDKLVYNVGVNHLSCEQTLCYALPDIIAHKILTGQTPQIEKAYRFIPKGKQKTLCKATVLGIELNPAEENIFKKLVEERQRIKSKLKDKSLETSEKKLLEMREKALKIIINATSYGIFFEMNKQIDKEFLEVYSIEHFTTEGIFEEEGTYFNPIIATLLTAGARLMIMMAETYLQRKGTKHCYSDTDSVFIAPEYVDELIAFFESLNPYSDGYPLLKKEKENVLFYGISAKRYVLYTRENNMVNIIDHSLHGLGYLTNPFPKTEDDEEHEHWHKQVWLDILDVVYGKTTKDELAERYKQLYAIEKITVSTQHLYRRFKKLNKSKPYEEQIKPFNFALVGVGLQKHTQRKDARQIKPLTPFRDDPQEAVFEPFIDSGSCKAMQGIEYWTPLSKIILDYMEHPEAKFDGNEGWLERKHIHATGVVYIGKEATDIERLELGDEYYTSYEQPQLFEKFKTMTSAEAKKKGIGKWTLSRIRKKMREGKKFRVYRKTRRKLCR